MTLPVIHGSWREYERGGCPLVSVGGGECVDLGRVVRAFGLSRKETLKRLAAVSLWPQPADAAPRLEAAR